MNLSLFKERALAFALGIFFAGSFVFGASLSPALLKAKQDADAKGYVFFATHNEIVAGAKKEGKLG